MNGDQTDTAPETQLDCLVRDNPLSIYNSLSATIKSALDKIPDPYWTQAQEPDHYPRSSIDIRIKLRLWELYASSRAHGRAQSKITFADLADGICTTPVVSDLFRNPLRAAWVLVPPKDYEGTINAAQELWLSRIFEILALPIKDPVTGKLNVAAAKLVLQAGIAVDLRKHGSPLMRTEQKNLNVNVDGNKPQTVSLEDLDKKLLELEEAVNQGVVSLHASQAKPKAIEAEFTEVSDE